VVTSWSQGKQDKLELLVQPRRGLTADLLRHTRSGRGVSFSFPAYITGPHGVTEPVGQYETVVIIASGFGVAAVIPYLKQLIYGYNTSTSRTRRVHFVWQLQTLGNY
jgi:NAD(P)H-flavin reductase